MPRKVTPKQIETDVLVKSRRRCCICFGLDRDTEMKLGQIAHLDGNPANSAENNLAFLYLEHHAVYDSTSRQSKNITLAELRHYRAELHEAIHREFDKTVFITSDDPKVLGFQVSAPVQHYVRVPWHADTPK